MEKTTEIAIPGWGCPSPRPRLRPRALLLVPPDLSPNLTSGRFQDCLRVCQRGQNARPEKACECSVAQAQRPEAAALLSHYIVASHLNVPFPSRFEYLRQGQKDLSRACCSPPEAACHLPPCPRLVTIIWDCLGDTSHGLGRETSSGRLGTMAHGRFAEEDQEAQLPRNLSS